MDLYTQAALVARLAEPYFDDWGHQAVSVAIEYLQVDIEDRTAVYRMAVACLVFSSYPKLTDGGISPQEFRDIAYGTDIDSDEDSQ